MSLSHFKIFSVLILAPYIVGLTPADSSYNEYSFAAGGGQYAMYDCSGEAHPNSIADLGVKVTHKFEAPLRIGATVSAVSLNGKMTVVPYPDVALDLDYFSLGTTGVRIGSEDGYYAELSMFDQVPFFSGRGCFRAGAGMKPGEHTRLWLGVNTFPYHKPAFAGQVDFPITNTQFLFLNGRYGKTGGVPEYGVSIGTRIRMR